MPEEAMDFIMNGQAYGSVAQKMLANSMNINALRTNATLRYDEWKIYDTAVVKACQLRLRGVADLLSRGLEYNIGNGLGKTVLQYEDSSDMTDAEMSMDGINRGKGDRIEFTLKYLPLPIIHKDFQLNARVLQAGRVTGQPIDTAQAELSAFKVAEKMEKILFNGSSDYSFGGGTIYGYLDAPNKNSVSLTMDWNDASKTGELILADVLAMKQASITARHFGPWILYVPVAYETKLDNEFKTYGVKTIRQRLLEIDGIQDVKVSDHMTAAHVALVQMTPDTVRMVTGLPVTTVEWQSEGNMLFHFKVMTIMVPQVRADQNSRSGITILA